MNKFDEFMGNSFDPMSGEFDLEGARKSAIANKDKINILICGLTGVGKSTLVNAIFGSEVAKAGVGEPITQHLIKIDVPEKGLCLWDTKGIEAKDYKQTMDQLRSDIKIKKGDEQFPHIAWLVINAKNTRVQQADYELIDILKGEGIPTAVVFSNVYGKTEKENVETLKNKIDDQAGEYIDGAYVSVNSTPYELDEDIVIPARGLDDLVKVTSKLFPKGQENVKRAFLKAQRQERKARLEEMQRGARQIVHLGAAAAGAVGASPVPGSDAPLIAAAQSAMIYKINTEFELNISDSLATATITGILGVTALAQVGKTVVANALKFIPGVGTIAGAAISSTTAIALTQAVGHAYIATLSHYYDIDTGDVKLPDNASALMAVFKSSFSYKR